MSSILEHMCADVLQQTATQIKFPSTGMDTMPYWNLLPPKRPIKEVLTDIFAKVLEKGWVDSRSIHVFDTLLHMGGVYWFCNNLIKVRGCWGWAVGAGILGLPETGLRGLSWVCLSGSPAWRIPPREGSLGSRGRSSPGALLGSEGSCGVSFPRVEGPQLLGPPPAPQELLKETRKESTLRAVELLYSIFCLDMQQAALVLLGHILPGLLTDSSKWHSLMDPPGTALAK